MESTLETYGGKRVLIAGGLGFLGLNLTQRLVQLGASVKILNRSGHPQRLEWLQELTGDGAVDLVLGDITDPAALDRWLEDSEILINLAGRSGAARSVTLAQADMEMNVAGHLHLLEALRGLSSPPRVVFASSRLVYGATGEKPVTESDAPLPTSLYGLHKLAVEHYHRLYELHFGIPYAIARLTNPYGPYQSPDTQGYGIINRFVAQAVRDESLQLFGGGPQLRDYLYVSDAVDALLLLGVADAARGKTFNVGSGSSRRLGDVAQQITEIAGSGRLTTVPWPELDRRVETGDFVCDVSLIQHTLGWSAQIPLETGLSTTIDQCRRDQS